MDENTAKADPLATCATPPSPQYDTIAADSINGEAVPLSGSGRLEVRCPICHIPTHVAADTTLTDLTCSSCGSHFSLVDHTQATRMAPSLSQLGHFELIERLGVGGFGSVWKARDKELDRTVAIKIPRAGAMTAVEQEQFFREARAAAQLRHPSIVSVHEVGRDGDSIYIVSEFVRGVTLGDWLTGQRLTGHEAVELCDKIADALHHAHEQGVIHRDLKPANIMMDFEGQPHLMDFGLARRDSGEVTVTMDGQVLGTPAYMSPEQAQGEGHSADRRSDVYSLGVIAYQLLTGELPFRGNVRMLLKQVIHDEPPSPRKLDANVSKDMETIVLKCLQKDPARRYATAADLAADLRRHLKGEPIAARPIGALQRRWSWCRRNPAVASLSAAAIGLLVVIAIVTSVGYASTSRALREKEQAAATSDQVSKFLADLFRSSDPTGWASGDNFEFVTRNATSANLTVRQLIDRGAKRIQTELAEQPEVQATLLETIGGVYRELGLFAEAASILEDALHKREAIVPAEERKIATAKHNVGNALCMIGKYKEAEGNLRSALDTRRRLLGNDNLDTSSTLQSLALALGIQNKYDEGTALVDEAIAIRRRLKGNDSQGVAIGLAIKASISLCKGDVKAANPSIAEALIVFSKQQNDSYAADAIVNYQQGMLALGDKRYAKAEKLMKDTLESATKLLGAGHPYIAFIAAECAEAQSGMKNYQAACNTDELAMAICKKTLPLKHPMVVLLGRRLTKVYAKLNRFDDAIAMSDQIIPDAISLHGDDSFQHAGCLMERAIILRDWGKTSEAVKTARESYAVAAKLPATHSGLWEYQDELAQCLLLNKQPDEALTLLNTISFDVQDEAPDSKLQASTSEDAALDDSMLGEFERQSNDKSEWLEQKGKAFFALGKFDDAIGSFQAAQNLTDAETNPQTDWGAHLQTLRARALLKKGSPDDAEKLLQQSHATLARLSGDSKWTKEAAETLKTLRAGR